MTDAQLPSEKTLPRAFLIGVYFDHTDKEKSDTHLHELSRLVDTFGAQEVGRENVHVREPNAATFFGSGKLKECEEKIKAHKAAIVVIDGELSPSQQRKLEEIFACTVADRSEVIIEVFSRHARSKEARLQVERAQIEYQFPRLKRLWGHLSRQRGGSVNQKGEGEKQIELDRRMLQKRLHQLDKELEVLASTKDTQRRARLRNEIPSFAIVGYTNAGKSTLLKALTDADVLVEDKLFATLDTTSRKYSLEGGHEVILTDTVGFIRKLPHFLVESFQSTLNEAKYADFLLHIIDISDASYQEQLETTQNVLKDLGLEKKPQITVLNKIDKLEDKSRIARLRFKCPRCVPLCAATKEGFEDLHNHMRELLSNEFETIHLLIPQSEYHIIDEIARQGVILNRDYNENNILLSCELPKKCLERFAAYRSV